MSRELYGLGAHGGVVTSIQRALRSANFDTKGTDGVYGNNTAAAVKAFQGAKSLPVTGIVDDVTWREVMQLPIPGLDVRSLELTAAFEGHGYSLAQGNWDAAWLTWGIIGFTLKHGEIQKIILTIQRNQPELIRTAFGGNTDNLLQVMNASPRQQEAWADSISMGSRVTEPWRSAFSLLGQFPEVQEQQCRIAHDDYFVPATNTARTFNLHSELGLALCFDIHVQNGGVGADASLEIREAIAKGTLAEQDLRKIIANAVADNAKDRFKADVRQRKLAIAQGEGDVHGAHFVLKSWALDNSATPELL
jgi:hypothetical protein